MLERIYKAKNDFDKAMLDKLKQAFKENKERLKI